MRLITFLLICFTISLLPMQRFFNNRSSLFLDKIAQKNYVYNNYNIQAFDSGRSLVVSQQTPQQILTQRYFLYSVFTSSKAVYTNTNNEFIGIIVIDKSIYQTKKASSIFDIDFANISIFGSLKEIFF